ncbi:MAG: DUF4180 domain-containing protein [Clostridia bacterium]|nr:DUF4180 domain-containing protein [Clostridia bacterium]
MELRNFEDISIITSEEKVLTDVQSSLDLLVSVRYHTGNSKIIIKKEAINDEFFDLSTKLAGEILQKFINYEMKIAIVGDFGNIISKSLNDFIYECNRGRHIFFLSSEEEAIERLKNV